MSGPVLVAVDEDAGVIRDVERELRDRYARHYRVVCIRSPREVLALLEELAADREQVALVLAGQALSDMTGGELLDQARHLHPHPKRRLLMAWDNLGDRATGEAIFDSIARGWIDHYVVRPSEPSDEDFHHATSRFLLRGPEARARCGGRWGAHAPGRLRPRRHAPGCPQRRRPREGGGLAGESGADQF